MPEPGTKAAPSSESRAVAGRIRSRWRIARDLVRLLRGPPGCVCVFLRREFDHMESPLRRAAMAWRWRWLKRTRIVAITGSIGKTTTRATVHAALACPDRDFSYSNHGASLAANLMRVRPDRHTAIEVGINGPKRMRHIIGAVRPDVVVTASASDHNRSFPTLLHTRAEKVEAVRQRGRCTSQMKL